MYFESRISHNILVTYLHAHYIEFNRRRGEKFFFFNIVCEARRGRIIIDLVLAKDFEFFRARSENEMIALSSIKLNFNVSNCSFEF